MKALENKDFFQKPRPMFAEPEKRNKKLFCAYHKDHGHRTEDCKILKYNLEAWAKEGKLNEFIARSEKGQSSEQKKPENKAPQPTQSKVLGRIDMITGGYEETALSTSQLRAQYRMACQDAEVSEIGNEPLLLPRGEGENGEKLLFFGDAETDGTVRCPHNDALVVRMLIGNYDVGKVYVDNGASVNVMFQKLFSQLGLRDSDLKPCHVNLKAFNGNMTFPLGQITLPVRAGPVQSMETFVVIQERSAYNVILGRPWIHAIKAVPSSYHQSIRFPSPEGVMEIRGNQATARECFLAEYAGHSAPSENKVNPKIARLPCSGTSKAKAPRQEAEQKKKAKVDEVPL